MALAPLLKFASGPGSSSVGTLYVGGSEAGGFCAEVPKRNSTEREMVVNNFPLGLSLEESRKLDSLAVSKVKSKKRS